MSTGTLNREPGISLGAQPVPTTRESASDLVEVWAQLLPRERPARELVTGTAGRPVNPRGVWVRTTALLRR